MKMLPAIGVAPDDAKSYRRTGPSTMNLLTHATRTSALGPIEDIAAAWFDSAALVIEIVVLLKRYSSTV